MKIAYLSTFYPFRGGIAQFNASLSKSLRQYAEVQPFNFTRQYPKLFFPGKTQLVQSDDNVEKIDSVALLDTINPLSYFTASRKIKQFNPDLILTKFWMPFFAPSLGTVLFFSKNPIKLSILDNIEPHEKQPGSRFFTKYFLNQNDGFIVMSQKVGNDLLNYLTNAKMILLHHPLYEHFGDKIDKNVARNRLNLPRNKKILLFFGFIRSYKGLDLALQTLALLDESYHLVVAGESYTSFDIYQNMISELGIQDKVSLFIHYISNNEVPYFFCSADVCILPYKSATQSGIVGISYYFDLPVIATGVGGLKEMIEPFGSGIIVERLEANAFREAIEKYFQNDKQKFLSGIEEYKKIANWNFFAQKVIEFYVELKQLKRASDNIV
ncbi:MAG: glycosyltransferase [Candidatus Kapaibacteriales bacterium]